MRSSCDAAPVEDRRPDDDKRTYARWPLVGCLVGGAVAAVWCIGIRVLPPGIVAGLALAAGLLLTGARHEEGFAKLCDGFGAGGTRERMREIMRDSRIGAFGAVGLVLLLGLKWQAMIALPPFRLPGALICAHVLSRCTAGIVASVLPHADISQPQDVPGPATSGVRSALAAAACGLASLALLPAVAWLPGLILATCCGVAGAIWLRRRLGGWSEESLGAIQQLAELAVLLAAFAGR